MPSSFICFKSLKDIYNKALESDKLIVGQFQNLTCNEKLNRDVIASPLLMASTPNNSTIQNFNNYLSELNSKDLTNEQDFLGKVNLWLETNDTISICGRTIGTLKKVRMYNMEMLGLELTATVHRKITMMSRSLSHTLTPLHLPHTAANHIKHEQ